MKINFTTLSGGYNMFYIALDVSIASTAMVILNSNTQKYYFFSYTNQKENNKWIKSLSEIIDFRFNYRHKPKDYSNGELANIHMFNNIADDVMSDIKNITKNDVKNIVLEGYSYLSKGRILDLVSIGAIIRSEILRLDNVDYGYIVSPKHLKVETCRLVYGETTTEEGKRKKKLVTKVNPNYQGVMGNDFEKEHMVRAALDSNLDNKFIEWLRNNPDVMLYKSTPKPVDDIVDALFLIELLKLKVND